MNQIFVEGPEDKSFILSLLNYLSINTSNLLINFTGGFTNLSTKAFINQLKENTNNGGKNYVIFDADTNKEEKEKYLNGLITTNAVDFEYFLFPNNTSPGTLDSLIISMCKKEHESILYCFDSYISCIKSLNSTYKIPHIKYKIFAYFDTLKKKTKIEERNYFDSSIFNLDCDDLNELKNYLKSKLS